MSAKDDKKLIYDTKGQLHRADERYKKVTVEQNKQ